MGLGEDMPTGRVEGAESGMANFPSVLGSPTRMTVCRRRPRLSPKAASTSSPLSFHGLTIAVLASPGGTRPAAKEVMTVAKTSLVMRRCSNTIQTDQ